MTDREKGASLGSVACPGCGAELAYSVQPDGALSAETCSACHPQGQPQKKAEKASTSETPRERGTLIEE